MKCTFETKSFTYTGKTGTAELCENTAVVTLPGITREYTAVQISDLHIAALGEGDTEKEAALARHEIDMWGWQSVPVTHDGVTVKSTAAACSLVIERINELAPDAVFVCGDISDIGTRNSYLRTAEIISKIVPPKFLTPGNHEQINAATPPHIAEAFEALYGEVNPVDIFHLGKIKIIRLDSSRTAFTDEQRETVERELSCGEPAVIFTHVPVFTDHLLSVTGPAWAEYFLAGMPKHDEATIRFAKMIREKKPLVIAGHTHAKLDYPDREPLQLISTPCFTGYYRIIHFIPEV